MIRTPARLRNRASVPPFCLCPSHRDLNLRNCDILIAMSKLLIASLTLAAVSRGATGAPMTVRLLSSLPSPQPVGTVIGLVPHVENAAEGMLVFRYSVS